MRYLIDTNIFIYLATDISSLSNDINAIIQDYDSALCISAESLRELVIGYRNNSFSTKSWKTCTDLLKSIENEFNIKVLPLKKEHMITYSKMTINEAEGHRDPSDHVIIAQAITEKIPLISSDRRFPFYKKQGLDLIFNKR